MIDKLLSPDAYLNYFAEIIGIIITVILIPFVLNIYFKQKNYSKKYFAEKILMTKLNNILEKIVPMDCRDFDKEIIWINKNTLDFRINRILDFSQIQVLPFSIKVDEENSIESFYISKFNALKNDKIIELSKIHFELQKSKNELEVFLSIYGEVINNAIYREYYVLDYDIQAIDIFFDRYDENDYSSFSETISIVIYTIDKMRKILLKKYKEENKDFFKIAFNGINTE